MSPRRNTNSASRGFTLVEATLAIAITAMLLAGMGAALIASASAADMGRGASGQAISTMQALDQIRAEVAVARKFLTRTSTNIAFTIADRNGDGNDETIEYYWSGKPGTALYREMNATGRSPMIAACDSVDFAFLIQPSPETKTGVTQTLLNYVGNLSSNANAQTLTAKAMAAQSWQATSAPSGVAYRIGTVRLALARGGMQSMMLRLRVIAMDSAQPATGTLLGTATIMSNDIPQSSGYAITAFTFGTPAVVDPRVGAWFVIDAPSARGNAAYVAYDLGQPAQPTTGAILVSTDSGATWTNYPDGHFSMIIEGNETTVTYPAEVMQ